MSVNHHDRIEGIVKGVLKEAAMGEPFGYSVSFGYWPLLGPKGEPVGMGAAWMIAVSVRGTSPGDEDIVTPFPVPGFLPPDEAIRNTAAGLLEQCRKDRSQAQSAELAAARALFQEQVKGNA